MVDQSRESVEADGAEPTRHGGVREYYVDIFSDEQDRIWIGVHFGSRGLGHKTAKFFLNAAGARDGMDVDPCVIQAQADLGIDYLECMRLGGLVGIRWP